MTSSSSSLFSFFRALFFFKLNPQASHWAASAAPDIPCEISTMTHFHGLNAGDAADSKNKPPTPSLSLYTWGGEGNVMTHVFAFQENSKIKEIYRNEERAKRVTKRNSGIGKREGEYDYTKCALSREQQQQRLWVWKLRSCCFSMVHFRSVRRIKCPRTEQDRESILLCPLLHIILVCNMHGLLGNCFCSAWRFSVVESCTFYQLFLPKTERFLFAIIISVAITVSHLLKIGNSKKKINAGYDS